MTNSFQTSISKVYFCEVYPALSVIRIFKLYEFIIMVLTVIIMIVMMTLKMTIFVIMVIVILIRGTLQRLWDYLGIFNE